MKSQKSGADRKREAAFILDVLAEKLPDHILQEYFRDLAPKQVRKTLQETSEVIKPRTKNIGSLPPSQLESKAPGKGKEWKGKEVCQSSILKSKERGACYISVSLDK